MPADLDDSLERVKMKPRRRPTLARVNRSKVFAREAQAMKIRRGIRVAQLRVALDKERGRETPEAVVRLSNLKLPEVTGAVKTPMTRARHLTSQ
jgi:hypothetical protein